MGATFLALARNGRACHSETLCLFTFWATGDLCFRKVQGAWPDSAWHFSV